ncbi:hypothetical protein WN55_06828, partial [Dufourea novaeangliae]
LIQSSKASDKLLCARDHRDNESESNKHFQLPSLQKRKTWKDVEGQSSTWDKTNRAIVPISPSYELEDSTTIKVKQQWNVIESTLYEGSEQVTHVALLAECMQWRKQIPHLRVVGRNPFIISETNYQSLDKNTNRIKNSFKLFNNKIFSDSVKERKALLKHKSQSTLQDKILDILFKYTMSELFPNNENKLDSLDDDFNRVLQIQIAPIHSNKSSARSTKLNWFEETIPLDKVMEDHIPIKKGTVQTDIQEIQRKYDIVGSEKSDTFAIEEKHLRPHTSRNKLGTVFNEKIVVSPVPYILSTRESFSTIKTTPIKFMGQSLNISTFQGSIKNVPNFINAGNSSTPTKYSSYQSAWHAPVSPAMWPKNLKLAPLDTSQLPSTKNRSLASSSVVLQRNRKPLSPIARSTPPVSTQTTYNNKKSSEIQKTQITPGQFPKLSITNTSSENSVRNSKNKKERNQSKAKLQ